MITFQAPQFQDLQQPRGRHANPSARANGAPSPIGTPQPPTFGYDPASTSPDHRTFQPVGPRVTGPMVGPPQVPTLPQQPAQSANPVNAGDEADLMAWLRRMLASGRIVTAR